ARRSTKASTSRCCTRCAAQATGSMASLRGALGRVPRLFRSNLLRLTLAYMALFALSVGALSAFIYWATLGYLDEQTNAVIDAEISGLAVQYERSSLRGLADVIAERVQR